MAKDITFPAEWEKQSATLLTWPAENTDWQQTLDIVHRCYINIANEIAKKQPVVILCKKREIIEPFLKTIPDGKVLFLETNYNDTWIRDYGPITIYKEGRPLWLNFRFNGWGLTFASNYDNQVNKHLYKSDIFNEKLVLVNRKDFVLEGGSIETDGKGTLLVTQRCLLSANRNDHFSKIEIEEELKQTFGADRVLWLKHGYLEGDDTGGHIDTLVRFANKDTLMYAACDNKEDPHFEELTRMKEQLNSFTSVKGKKYNLVPLPLPTPVYATDGNRLPATYLNFLFVNDAVLLPVYDNEKDNRALEIFRTVFPEKEIVAVPCLPLLHQNGSLHCATMHLPAGCI